MAVYSAQIDGYGKITTENLKSELDLNFNSNNSLVEETNGWSYKANQSYFINKNGRVIVNKVVNLEIERVENKEIILKISTDSNENLKYINIADAENNKNIQYDELDSEESYFLEISYMGGAEYKKEISIEYELLEEEQILEGEGVTIDTKGKWYYVKYGANDTYKYKWVKGDKVSISNTTMGDPTPGVAKKTYLVAIANFR